MESDKALGILKALADGVDPRTGAAFPADSPYQHPDSVRALCWAVQALEHPAPARERPVKPRSAPANAGRPWSEEDDARLARGFDAGRSVAELAEEHQRSRWAIEARLVRLNKMPPPPSGPAAREAVRTGTAAQ
jgi:hypothetical protein